MFYIKRISLIVIKTFLTYSLIILLKQRVNNLNMFIIVKKIVVITFLRFFFKFTKFENFYKIHRLITIFYF